VRARGRGRWWAAALVGVAVVVAAGCVPPHPSPPVDAVGDVDPGSQLVGCDQATQRIAVSGTVHLDPSCTYTRGIDITTSHTTLDCRGASITFAGERQDKQGILIETPFDVPLDDVTVRNCNVSGFAPNNLRIRREGFKDVEQGHEYEAPTSNIRIEHSKFSDSDGSGVYVDAYVQGVTLDDIEVVDSGAVGIYFEAGSKDNVLEHSRIHRNGFKDVVPEGVPIVVNGTELRYESTGREGIAVDGARNTTIRDNWIAGNSYGGIFFYKNCGEDATTNPDGHWVRHYGATGNLVERNFISSEKNGIWVGSRAAENQSFMDCSDTPYVDAPARQVFLDPASGNTIRDNSFLYVQHGIRVEDDATTIDGNRFSDVDPSHEAILVGTKERTNVLAQPVKDTVITANRADITGNANPYRWIWGQTNTTFADNLSGPDPATLTEGTQPTINPFLFAIRIFLPS
jgi:hypothetical protein